MHEYAVLEAMKDLGYQLLAEAHHHSPGGSGLLVAIRKEPTGRHFDPEAMRLRLREHHGLAKLRSLSLRSPAPDSDHVCPGRVIIRDRIDKRVEFFTFGGSLEVIPAPDAHVYALRSPAPVIQLIAEEQTVADHLVAETESLLGQLEVRWEHDQDGFNRRLAEIEPLEFYVATLHALIERLEHRGPMEETHHELRDLLLREREWLSGQGLWPANVTAVESLFATG